MFQILEKIKEELWSNIWKYCICWSWKYWIDCCMNGWNDFPNLLFNNPDNILQQVINSEGERKIDKDLIDIFNRDIFAWKCILKWCQCKPIGSHFYPDWYLKNLTLEFSSSTTNSKLSKHWKTSLFCKNHDNELFKLTDGIVSFSDLVLDENIRNNWFLKVLFFKYKTISLLLRYCIVNIKVWNCSFQDFFTLYKQYDVICDEIEKFEYAGKLRFYPLINDFIDVDWNSSYILFSNICFIPNDNTPFWVIITYDKWWLSIVIWTYWKKLNGGSSVLRDIKWNINYIKMEIFPNNPNTGIIQLIEFLNRYFFLEKSYNREIVIENEFLDIWITNKN